MRCLAIFSLLVVACNAAVYKLCVTDEVSPSMCNLLQSGNSQVKCDRVTDSSQCAIRLARNEADFGVFEPEELLLAYQFYPNEIMPIFQLKNRDKLAEEFEFQAVAVVPKSVKPVGHATDFTSLKNGGLCHPGFSDAQGWNDYVLKIFERIVSHSTCRKEVTAAENEAEHLRNFFGKACRPGEWVAEPSFDAELKKKYPELCALCDDTTSCKYKRQEHSGHVGALDCLSAGRGKVAYAALSHVRTYFKPNETEYQFLCKDGTTQSLSTETPCAWIKQPWGVIAARKPIAKELSSMLKKWLTPVYAGDSWMAILNSLLQDDNVAIGLTDDTSLVAYLSRGREVDLPYAQRCDSDTIKWCTIGDLETAKCTWVAAEAKALGIEPQIACHNSSSTFQCFRDISSSKADVMVIDSNYGHLARMIYGLSTVLYSETNNDKNSIVVAVTREPQPGETPINSLKSLKGRKACFPEYGGIAWMSFVHVIRLNGLISTKSCDYPKEVANFLGGACAPGIRDNDHSNKTVSQRRANILSTLCSVCPSDSNCAANDIDPYYKDNGALDCLSSGAGDIAFLEINNLDKSWTNGSEFRLLCRNGSLAHSPGFHVDELCAWSVTIDSEVVGRKNSSHIDTLDTNLALLKMNNWLGYRLHTTRPINMYGAFNGTSNLLFKDSTISLVTSSSNIRAVEAYKELFKHVDHCTGGAMGVVANFVQLALCTLLAVFIGRHA